MQSVTHRCMLELPLLVFGHGLEGCAQIVLDASEPSFRHSTVSAQHVFDLLHDRGLELGVNGGGVFALCAREEGGCADRANANSNNQGREQHGGGHCRELT